MKVPVVLLFATFLWVELGRAADSPTVPNYFYVQEEYGKQYVRLPFNFTQAQNLNWTVATECVSGVSSITNHPFAVGKMGQQFLHGLTLFNTLTLL